MLHFANHAIPDIILLILDLGGSSGSHERIRLARLVGTLDEYGISLSLFEKGRNILIGHEVHIDL